MTLWLVRTLECTGICNFASFEDDAGGVWVRPRAPRERVTVGHCACTVPTVFRFEMRVASTVRAATVVLRAGTVVEWDRAAHQDATGWELVRGCALASSRGRGAGATPLLALKALMREVETQADAFNPHSACM
jgi:hypothetical protein